MTAAYFGEGGYGAPASVIPTDSAHPNHIVVPDAQLLFTAHFHRAGPDLVLTGRDGHNHIVPGYFSSEHPPALVAPNGAMLSPHLVDLLAGSAAPNEYAQTGPITPPDPIGRVEKVVGNVTVVRNGTAVTLNVGDAVYKSDVVQTSAGSSAGVAFPDGSALNLVANTRMALTEYSYDPNSTSNSALFNLVEGGLSFVAGKVAHTGDMKIGTPVATMGIRGTAGWLYEDTVANITANAGNVTLHFAAVFDSVTNTESTYTLYAVDANGELQHDANGHLISLATVSSTQNGLVTTLTGNGIGSLPSVGTAPPDITQQQFQNLVVPQVITMAIQAIQQYQNQQPNQQTNPQSTSPSGSGTPPATPHSDNGNPQFQQNENIGGTPITYTATVNDTQPTGDSNSNTNTQQQPTPSTTPSGPQTIVWNPQSGNFFWNNAGNWNGGSPGSSANAEIISATPAVVDDPNENINNLTVGAGATVEAVGNSGGTPSSLNVAGTTDDSGTIKVDSTTSDPTITFSNTVTVEAGGVIEAVAGGLASQIVFNDGATIDVNGTVEASGAGATIDFFSAGTVDDFGTILADNNGTFVFSAPLTVEAVGVVEASGSGSSITINDDVTIAAGGEINAHGGLASVTFDGGASVVVDNAGAILADDDGKVDIFDVQVTNELSGIIEAASGGVVTIDTANVANAGTIEALGAGSSVELSHALIEGGTLATGDLSSAVNGEIHVIGESEFDGSTDSVTVNAFVQVDDGISLDLLGAIDNAGTIVLGSESGAQLTIEGPVTLSSFGEIALEGSASVITGAGDPSDELINSGNTISGSGTIEDLTLDNQSGGVIDATGGTLIIDTGHTVTNAGTLEATSGGTLQIEDSVSNAAGGAMTAAAGGSLSVDAHALTNGGTITANGGSVTIDNAQIQNSNLIFSDNGGSLTLSNDGVGESTFDNTGAIEAFNKSAIDIVDFTIDNSGGTITVDLPPPAPPAPDNGDDGSGEGSTTAIDVNLSMGSQVNLDDVTIVGGLLQTAFSYGIIGGFNASSVIETVTNPDDSASTSVLDGVNNEANVLVNADTTLVLRDTINNDGAIGLAPGSNANLAVDGEVTLTGTGRGEIVMQSFADDHLEGFSDANVNTLENVNNLVIGAGQIGDNLILKNDAGGTIEAWAAVLSLDTGDNTITNAGHLEADAGPPEIIVTSGTIIIPGIGGTLEIESSVDNNGGTISADGDGSSVQLFDVTITGGRFVTGDAAASDNGVIEVMSTDGEGTTVFDGSADNVTVDAFVQIDDGGNLELLGTIDNEGTFSVASGATLSLAGATLDGGTVADDGNIDITSSSKITDGAVVQGDVGALTVDSGIILTLDDATLENLDVTNDGTLQVDSGHVLTLSNTTVDGGTIVIDAGATLTLDDATLENVDVINHGTLHIDSGDTLTLIDSIIDSGALTVDSGGTLYVESDGATFDGVNVSNGGTIQVDADLPTITPTILTLDDDATISGGTLSIGEHGVVDVATGTGGAGAALTDATVNNSGVVQVDIGATLTLSGDTISGGAINLAQGSEQVQSVAEISVPGLSSYAPAMSANGGVIAFQVSDSLPGDSNGGSIELYNASSGHVTDISALVDQHPGETFSNIPSISSDGNDVVFTGDYQINSDFGSFQTSDVLLYNAQTQQVTVAYSNAGHAVISGNGQFIAAEANSPFDSTPHGQSVVVTDQSGHLLTQITGDPSYVLPNDQSDNFGNIGSAYDPAISGNGRYVTFWSTSSIIAVTQGNATSTFSTGNTTGTTDNPIAEVYLYDRQTNTLQEVSGVLGGLQGNGDSGTLSIADHHDNDWASSLSSNGRYVVFQSDATNLAGNTTPGDSNIFLYDSWTHSTQLVSAGVGGVVADGASDRPAISADGDYVSFSSTATNLVTGSTGGTAETYVYNTQTGAITLVSASADGIPANAESDLASTLSANGAVVAYGGTAENLGPNTNPGSANVFIDNLNQTPSGALDVTADTTITGGATVTGGTVTVEAGATLTLDGVTINGSTIDLAPATETTQSVSEISVPHFFAIAPAVSADGTHVAFIASTSLPGQHGDVGGAIDLYDFNDRSHHRPVGARSRIRSA